MVKVQTVANDAEHEHALARIEDLWGTTDPREQIELDALVTLVDRYERDRWPVTDDLDPIDLIRHAMSDDVGHTRKELVALLGAQSRVSEILNRKRALTLPMIRAISDAWGIPISLLAAPYALANDEHRRLSTVG